MISLDKVEALEGIQVYGDDAAPDLFYAIPEEPRFRTDSDGLPVLHFLRYVTGPRPDEKPENVGGAYCFFDVELAISPEQDRAIRAGLTERHAAALAGARVRLASPVYLDGSVTLNLRQDDRLIESFTNPGRPSLVGRNIGSFTVRLFPEGAVVFAAAMQGPSGAVQIAYELSTLARLGGTRVEIACETEQLATFLEQVSSRGLQAERQLSESLRESRVGTIKIDSTLTDQSPEGPLAQLRAFAQRTLEEQLRRQLAAIAAVTPEQRKQFEEQSREARQGQPDPWFWFWFAAQSPERRASLAGEVRRSTRFSMVLDERTTIQWKLGARGTLPGPSRLRGLDGKPLSWGQFSHDVSTVDDFFRRVRFRVGVNADFARMQIHTVAVAVRYGGDEAHYTFRSADERSVYVAQYAGTNAFEYRYTVHFVGQSSGYESPWRRQEGGDLLVDVGALGVLAVRACLGIKLDDEIRAARIELRYEDADRGVDVQRTILFHEGTKDREVDVVVPVFAEVRRPYRYRITYQLRESEITLPEQESRSDLLLVRAPFSGPAEERTFLGKHLGPRGHVASIRVFLEYEDQARGYVRRTTLVLDGQKELDSWKVPVVEQGAGRFSYRAVVTYKPDPRRDPVVLGPSPADALITVLPPD